VTDRLLDLVELHDAAVAPDAPLADVARSIYSGVGAVAVVDGGRVVGMVTEDDLIRATFPGYLDELTQTAFVESDEHVRPHFEEVAQAAVERFMRKAEVVELPTSALDVAQRFLHSDAPALVAVRDGHFAGVIDQTEFCRAVLGSYGWRV